MEEAQTNQYQEEILNLADLKGEEITFNLDQIRENPADVQKTGLKAPEDLSFDYYRELKLVEGFTPGALKNIITITKENLRVYGVSESKIWFISSSEVPEEVKKVLFPRRFSGWTSLLFNSHNTSLQFFFRAPTDSFILTLDPETGKLIGSEKISTDYSHFKYSIEIESSPAFPLPKNSKLGKFLKFYEFDGGEDAQMTQFALKVKNTTKGWFDLTRTFRATQTKERERFEAQKLAQLPESIRPLFNSSGADNSVISKSIYPGTCYICVPSQSAITTYQVSLTRRKILRSRSVNVLDILTPERIKDLVQNEEDGEEEDDERIPVRLGTVIFDEKSDSLIFKFMLNGKEVFVRIEKIFTSTTLVEENTKLKIIANEADNPSLLGQFSEDRLLCYSTKIPQDRFLRPVSFLRIQDSLRRRSRVLRTTRNSQQ